MSSETPAATQASQKRWFVFHWVLPVVVMAAFVVLGAIFVGGGWKTTSSSTAPGSPPQQVQFVDVVNKAAERANSADNEVGVVQARHARAKDMRKILPSLTVKGWIGTIDDVSTTLGGDAGVLKISITDDISVGTWNNGFSDLGDHTLINENSPLYEKLADLSEGDTVIFSGTFIADSEDGIDEQSVFDKNGMRTPTFTFKFSSITKQ